MRLSVLSPWMGAQVHGLDLSAPLSGGERQFVREAFDRHHLLVFADQRLDAKQQRDFSLLFGPYIDTHMKSPQDDVQYISNVVTGGAVGNGTLPFHSDHSFFEQPDTDAIVLYAIKLPSQGGDTLYANAALAFSDLDEDLKKRILPLHALHSLGAVYSDKAAQQAIHPLVWDERRSGERVLYMSELVKKIVELDDTQSEALVAALRAHIYREEFLYRHQWKVGDVVVWNNRLLQHARTVFDPAQERTLRRCTLGLPTKIFPIEPCRQSQDRPSSTRTGGLS